MGDSVQKGNAREALRRRAPVDHDELFIGFSPWAADLGGLARSSREILPEVPERRVLRTIWDHPEKRDARVLIDVVECPSSAEALGALADRLDWNELAELPEGPAGLGAASFVHPLGVPPAIFFARGNLCMSVVSFGRSMTDVAPFAQRLNGRLEIWERVERRALVLEAQGTRVKAGERLPIYYRLPWTLGEDGYVKFVATGGVLTFREGHLLLTPARPGEARIEALVAEPGRESYGGHLSVIVE